MAAVPALKLLGNKKSTQESDLLSAPGAKSQSHLTMNLEKEILRNPYQSRNQAPSVLRLAL